MGTTTYVYSKIVGWAGLAFALVFMSIFLFLALTANDNSIWIAIILIEAMLVAFALYFIRRCLIPALKKMPALTLDEDKLVFHVTGRIIYWKDVVEISWDSGRLTKFLSFDMLNDDDNISLGLAWIAGDNHEIYDTVQEYFRQALIAEGALRETE